MKPKVTRDFQVRVDYCPILERAGDSDEDCYAAYVDYQIASDPEAPPSDEQRLAQLLSRLSPKQIKELKDRAASMLSEGRPRDLQAYALICTYKSISRKERNGRSMWKFIAANINAKINAENPALHCNYTQRNLQRIYKNNR